MSGVEDDPGPWFNTGGYLRGVGQFFKGEGEALVGAFVGTFAIPIYFYHHGISVESVSNLITGAVSGMGDDLKAAWDGDNEAGGRVVGSVLVMIAGEDFPTAGKIVKGVVGKSGLGGVLVAGVSDALQSLKIHNHHEIPKAISKLMNFHIPEMDEVVPIDRDFHIWLHSGKGFSQPGGRYNNFFHDRILRVGRDGVTGDMLIQWSKEAMEHFSSEYYGWRS